MDKNIISDPFENPYSIKVGEFDTDKTKWEISKGIVQPNSNLPLPSELGELKYILEDILAGDSSKFDNELMQNLNIENIMAALEWLAREDGLNDSFKESLLSDGWRLNFKAKPPTPAEFLTDKYIGNQAESTFPWARDVFCDFMDPLKPYRTLVLAQHIGAGKSTLSTLVQLFISTHYAMMWHPWKYFNLAPSSVFTQCLGAWNQKKASELLLEPFVQILEQSPYFKRVRSHTDLVDAAAGELENQLHWTTSSPTAQPLDSKIIMADNSIKTMGEIKIGDKIKSPSEGVTEVINIPFEGEADCYEIELEDGRKVKCSDFHLWKVRRSPESEWEVQNLKYIMEHPEFDWEIIELDDFDINFY